MATLDSNFSRAHISKQIDSGDFEHFEGPCLKVWFRGFRLSKDLNVQPANDQLMVLPDHWSSESSDQNSRLRLISVC